MNFLLSLLLFLLPSVALGQHTHDGVAGKFYETWKMPANRDKAGNRIQGCCGRQDCRPILGMRRNAKGRTTYVKILPSQWEVLINVPYSGVPDWVAVPDSVWEDMQVDPRESPDERGHVCALYSGQVVCAVRTSDQ